MAVSLLGQQEGTNALAWAAVGVPILVALISIFFQMWRIGKDSRKREDFSEAPGVADIASGFVEINEKLEALARVEDSLRVAARDHVSLRASVTAIFEGSREAMFRTDASGAAIQVNDAYMSLFGFTDPATARSDAWLDMVKDRPLAEARFSTIFGSPPYTNFGFDMEMLDGRVLRVVGHPVVIDDDFAGYVGYVQDVRGVENLGTALRRIEDKIDEHVLWEMEQKYGEDGGP